MSNRWSLHSKFKDTFLHPFFIARKSLFNTIKENAKYAHGNLLDVGCGKKPYYELFSRRVQEYLGLDLPASKRKTIDIFADGLHLPFKSGSFDTVLSTEMIEHIPEPKDLLDEINRVLKREGILILSAPQVWGLHSEPKDFFRFTKYGLKYLMEKTNFQILRIQPTCGFWATYGQRLIDFLFQKYSKFRGGMVFIVPACVLIQFFSTILDKAYIHEGETLDHVVVASKK